jgi:hypothetical protein
MGQIYRGLNPTVNLQVCNACGSVVAGNEASKHDAWHEEQKPDNMLRQLGVAIAASVKAKFEA